MMDKIICVGKNYLEHAKELGDKIPEKPVLFLKPPSVLTEVKQGEKKIITIPKTKGAVHHECELVFKIGKMNSLEAITVGLDMTLRDLQTGLKKSGHPWTVSKVFQSSAIIGPWVSLNQFPQYLEEEFSLSINGSRRQCGKGNQMIFSPEQCLKLVEEFFPICEGDLLFTGTPKGVSEVKVKDKAVIQFGKISYELEFV